MRVAAPPADELFVSPVGLFVLPSGGQVARQGGQGGVVRLSGSRKTPQWLAGASRFPRRGNKLTERPGGRRQREPEGRRSAAIGCCEDETIRASGGKR
jgi:hypothetical protein